jgi:hypothetical protein
MAGLGSAKRNSPELFKSRAVQIRFERCLGSATTLYEPLPFPCHPERSRGTCGAPFVCPAPTGPQPPPISTGNPGERSRGICGSADHSWKPGMTKGRLFFMRFGDDWWRLWAGKSGAHEWRTTGPSAALGMTNKERGVARKGRLLNRGIFQTSPFSGPVQNRRPWWGD